MQADNVNAHIINLPSFMQPSAESYVGSYLEEMEPIFADRVDSIAKRILITLGALIVSIVDVIVWTFMTITVYPAYRIGKDHFINLIALVAMPILSFSLLFGYVPQVSQTRDSVLSLCSGNEINIERYPDNTASANYVLRKANTKRKKMLGIHTAAIYGKKHIANALLKSMKADPFLAQWVNSRKTPLHTAISGIVYNTFDDRTVVDTILSYNINPNNIYNGITPLTLASGSGLDIEVDKLLKKNADPNMKDDLYRTAIIAALFGIKFYGTTHDLPDAKDTVPESTIITAQDRKNKRSAEASTRVIQLLINAEVVCNDEHLNELDGFITAAKEKDEKAIKTWLDAEDAVQNLENRNPFRIFLKREERWLQKGLEAQWANFSNNPLIVIPKNIGLLTPIVKKEKDGVIERRAIVIDATGYLNHVRPMSRIISEYCYS